MQRRKKQGFLSVPRQVGKEERCAVWGMEELTGIMESTGVWGKGSCVKPMRSLGAQRFWGADCEQGRHHSAHYSRRRMRRQGGSYPSVLSMPIILKYALLKGHQLTVKGSDP